jgi:nitronate monooxygenase
VPIPHQFAGTLSAPIIAAPMFLVSGPDLVVETCRGGIVGTFPSLNQRTNEGYDAWLTEIQDRLATIHAESGPPSA